MTAAVDAGCTDLTGAEHLLHRLESLLARADEAERWASTHVPAPGRVMVVTSWPGNPAEATELIALIAAAYPDAGIALSAPGRRLATGPSDRVFGAAAVLDDHASRRAGRVVRFPGQARVETRLKAAEVVAWSGVDEVRGLAGVDVHPDAELDLAGYVRPTWDSGRCVVVVQQGAHALIPFEVRDQIPCCADH